MLLLQELHAAASSTAGGICSMDFWLVDGGDHMLLVAAGVDVEQHVVM